MTVARKLSALTSTVLLLIGSGSALGATKTVDDPRGDAAASYDISRVRYTHGAERVVAVAHVPKLGGRGRAELAVTNFTIFEAGYVARIDRRRGAGPRAQLLYYNHFDLLPRHCPSVHGSWEGGTVRLSIPKTCLKHDVGESNYLFMQFAVGQGSSFDRAPAVRRLAQS